VLENLLVLTGGVSEENVDTFITNSGTPPPITHDSYLIMRKGRPKSLLSERSS